MPSFSSEQLRKIFIGGLDLETTEESVQDYFSRWGECVDVVVMRHSDTGKPRGFGFVTYENVESVDAVLNVESHILDGKKIDPKRAVAREKVSQQEDEKSLESRRVFVGGLASTATEDDVRQSFTKYCIEAGYGGVQDVEIMKNRDDGKCRGFCFVTFHSEDIVNKVCSEKYFEIKSKSVEVRRAESRLAMRERKEKGNDFDRRRIADHRRNMNDGYQGPSNMRGNDYGSGFNPMAMQGAMSGGSGGGSGGFDGFSMNPMALAGMMNMIASYMGNMGGAMGNMGMNQMGNMRGAMGNMGMNPMGGGGTSGHNRSAGDLSSTSSGNYHSGNVSTSYPTGSDGAVGIGHGAQNSSMYNQQQAVGSMSDMSGYGNAMSAMFGAASVNPGNVQSALYSAYGAGNSGGGDSKNQLGVYNQSSSAYGPARNTSTGNAAGTNQGYKPY